MDQNQTAQNIDQTNKLAPLGQRPLPTPSLTPGPGVDADNSSGQQSNAAQSDLSQGQVAGQVAGTPSKAATTRLQQRRARRNLAQLRKSASKNGVTPSNEPEDEEDDMVIDDNIDIESLNQQLEQCIEEIKKSHEYVRELERDPTSTIAVSKLETLNSKIGQLKDQLPGASIALIPLAELISFFKSGSQADPTLKALLAEASYPVEWAERSADQTEQHGQAADNALHREYEAHVKSVYARLGHEIIFTKKKEMITGFQQFGNGARYFALTERNNKPLLVARTGKDVEGYNTKELEEFRAKASEMKTTNSFDWEGATTALVHVVAKPPDRMKSYPKRDNKEEEEKRRPNIKTVVVLQITKGDEKRFVPMSVETWNRYRSVGVTLPMTTQYYKDRKLEVPWECYLRDWGSIYPESLDRGDLYKKNEAQSQQIEEQRRQIEAQSQRLQSLQKQLGITGQDPDMPLPSVETDMAGEN